MTLSELRNLVLFQTNNDADDLGEFQPAIEAYINEGYDKLVWEFARQHLDDGDYMSLSSGSDEPEIPEWAHRAIADYATYMVYRNGNLSKQNRAVPFYQMFEQVRMKLQWQGANKNAHFYNLYN